MAGAGMKQVLLIMFGALLFCANVVYAHDLRVARIVLEDLGGGEIRLEAKLPPNVVVSTPLVPDACVLGDAVSRPMNGGAGLSVWQWSCDPFGFATDARIILPWAVEGAVIVSRDGVRDDRTRYFASSAAAIELPLSEIAGNGQSKWQGVGQYVKLGAAHILSGADHLALVFCLCVMARGRRLLGLITAFTVGHSLTLALAFLGWIDIPALPLEAVIALSIAFVAREALRPNDAAGHGYWLVAAFGLLHGMGFAGALSEIGVPRDDLLLSLASFNVGVEIGQLLFVGVVLAVQSSLRQMGQDTVPVLRASVFIVGTLGIYWTLDRVAAFVV
jgi:hypothetical protein